MSAEQMPSPEEIKEHLLEMVNNEANIKRMEAKAEKFINNIKPQMENYMDLVLNGERHQNDRDENQQTDKHTSNVDNQQSDSKDEESSLEEKVIDAGLDVLGSFF